MTARIKPMRSHDGTTRYGVWVGHELMESCRWMTEAMLWCLRRGLGFKVE